MGSARLLAIALAVGVGLAASAGSDEDVCRRLTTAFPTDALHDWVDGHRDRIAALLSSDDASRYPALVDAGRCADAEALLVTPFRDAFPKMACFFDPSEGVGDNPSHVWHIYVSTNVFPDLDLCFAEERLAAGKATLEAAGIALPVAERFNWDEIVERYGDVPEHGDMVDPARQFQSGVLSIEANCRFRRYQPACIAYGRLLAEGIGVQRSNDLAYVLLFRARLAGFGDRETVRLEAKVGARLSDDARDAAEERARASLAEIEAKTRQD